MTDSTDDMEYGVAMYEAYIESEEERKVEKKEKKRLINFVRKEVINLNKNEENNMFNINAPIKGIENTKPRILLYAMPKVGKTTFASKFKDHLLINLDGSSERIDCVRTPRIKTSREVQNIIDQLLVEDHNYKCLVIDTVDWLEKLICDEVAQENDKKTVEDIAYGRGFPLVVSRWRMFLEAMDKLRLRKKMTILLLAHADVRRYTPPLGEEYDVYSPKLYGKKEKNDTSLSLVLEFSDIIAFAHNKVRTKEIGEGFSKRKQPLTGVETILYTGSKNPCFVAGNRYGLTEEMPFSYENFAADFVEKTKDIVYTQEQEPVTNSEKRKPLVDRNLNPPPSPDFDEPSLEEVVDELLEKINSSENIEQLKNNCNAAAKNIKARFAAPDQSEAMELVKKAYTANLTKLTISTKEEDIQQ